MSSKWLRIGVKTLSKFRVRQKPEYEYFDELVNKYLRPHHIILDAGCGSTTRGAVKGRCQTVVGVDSDTRVARNPGCDVLVHAALSKLTFPDKYFDLVMSWTVLEHLDKPHLCFAEFSRVCKDGAIVILATPNIWHWANLLVKLTPYTFHEWFIKHVLGGKGGSYPTCYKVNSPKKLRKMMENEGFTTIEVRCIDSGPAYVEWFTPLYLIGLLYHRLVNRFNQLSSFRGLIIGVFERQCRV